ncbi:MAG: HPr family phosphocarrier protein [Candidatus Heimdallarchaeota archaeon]
MAKLQFTTVLKNKVGLHARPAAIFVRTSKKYDSKITVEKNGKVVDAKKILGVLALGAAMNDEIIVTIDGTDAEEARNVLWELIQNRFGED